MSDLLEEADIDYVHQRRVQLFKKLLPLVVLCTVLAIVIIGTKDWYYAREQATQEERSSLLVEALTDKTLSKEILTNLAKENDGVGDIAKFHLIDRNDKAKALEALVLLIEKGSSQVSKNLAKLEYAGILLDSEKLEPEQISKIQSLLVQIDKNQALYRNAQIYLCLFNIKIENLAKAKEIAQKLLEEDRIPDSIRSQAESIISYINEKESK